MPNVKKSNYDPTNWLKLYNNGFSYQSIAFFYGYSTEGIRKAIKHLPKKRRAKNAKNDIQDIISRLEIGTKSECWNWVGCLNNAGYGWVGYQNKIWAVHRLFYQLLIGEVGQLEVLHKCDNPRCCNPSHLFIGTQSDNMKDMISKKRDRHSKKKLKQLQNAD